MSLNLKHSDLATDFATTAKSCLDIRSTRNECEIGEMWKPVHKFKVGSFSPWSYTPRDALIHYHQKQSTQGPRVLYRIIGKEVAKVVVKRASPAELQILTSLRTAEHQCPFIVPLLDIMSSSNGLCAVFPWRQTLSHPQLWDFEHGVPLNDALQLSEDLLQGVAFLHEHHIAHLDIRLESLVYTRDHRLQIINFDSAMLLPSTDALINEYRGTEGWTAPEVGYRGGPRRPYDPFKADIYSSGLVLSFFASRFCGEDGGLACFATQLISTDPDERPSLSSWRRRS